VTGSAAAAVAVSKPQQAIARDVRIILFLTFCFIDVAPRMRE
jgi:hypothetical protein